MEYEFINLVSLQEEERKRIVVIAFFLISFNQAPSTKSQDHLSVIMMDSHFTLNKIPLDSLRLGRETLIV